MNHPSISPATAYRIAHGGSGYPADTIYQYMQKNGFPNEDGLTALASELKLPTSTLRSTLSYYADFTHPVTQAQQICNGTSCFLSQEDPTDLAEHNQCVSCLGYCYQEENYLENGTIHTMADTMSLPILCLAPQPVITRNLMEETANDLQSALKRSSYETFRYALQQEPEEIIQSVIASGLRGRGGADFPTGEKWQACASTESDQRYVIANGDEGDPGSYIDRILLENDPHSIIEGMLLCAYAIGASEGIVYIRSEYPHAAEVMQQAITEARDAGLFQAPGFSFNITIIHGAGSYVCGEETAMINAIEGLRGEVSIRPPYPSEAGLFGKPTVTNNVETLVNIPFIIGNGVDTYAAMGTPDSRGTKALCFNHGFHLPGIVEIEYGTSFQTAINAAGGSKTPLAAILLGGPMGCVLPPEDWDIPVCPQAMRERGLELGHGGIVALPKTADKKSLLLHWLEFMAAESCGKCTPCRIGSSKSHQIVSSTLTANTQAELEDLLNTIGQSSLCAFGREIPRAVSQYLELFGHEIFSSHSS